MLGIAVIGSTGGGAWQYSNDNGTTWINFNTLNSANARLMQSSDQVRFVPSATFTGVAKLTFRAWDRSVGTAGGTANLIEVGGITAFSSITRGPSVLVTA